MEIQELLDNGFALECPNGDRIYFNGIEFIYEIVGVTQKEFSLLEDALAFQKKRSEK